MKIDKKNRSLVNVIGAPLIVFTILFNTYTFYLLIFSIVAFSFYEFISLMLNKSKLTYFKLIGGFIWISTITLFIPLYESDNISKAFLFGAADNPQSNPWKPPHGRRTQSDSKNIIFLSFPVPSFWALTFQPELSFQGGHNLWRGWSCPF